MQLEKMSFDEAIADIPNRRAPLAIFCSPIVGEQLKQLCNAVDASEATLTGALGMRIYFDPEMSPNDFDVGYSEAEIRERVRVIRERETEAKTRPPA